VNHEELPEKRKNVVGLIYIEGTITKVAGQHIGIYVYDRYAKRIADLVGRRVKLIILDVADE
jgi:ClpP class serine protease